jgi:multiple sugar transport system substrate-binding protein
MIFCAVIIAGYLLIFIREPREEHPGRITIKLWNTTGAQEVDPPAPGWFNTEQDKIYVQRVGVPFLEIERKFITAVIGNVAPDLFEFFGPVPQWSSRGALIPLDKYMERDNFDTSLIFDALWDEMKWDGHTYAIPTGTACEAFYWNKAHFREAGLDPDKPPKTWDELEEFAEKLTIRNEKGKIVRAGYIPGYWDPFGTPLNAHWAIQKVLDL